MLLIACSTFKKRIVLGKTINTVEAGIAPADHQVPIHDIKTDVRSELF